MNRQTRIGPDPAVPAGARAPSRSARKIPLFRGLGDRCLDALLGDAVQLRCPRGTVLFREGDTADHLHILLSGRVELFTIHQDREFGILILGPDDVFVPAAAVFDEPYLTSARALVSCRILQIPAPVVRHEFQRTSDFALAVGRALAGQFRMAVRHVIDLKCRTAAQRLAAFLLCVVDRAPNGCVADLPAPKRHLAARVGMTAETLSRTLQTLADHGLLVRGSKIIVQDRQRIDDFCGPAPYPDHAETRLDVFAL